MSAHKTEEAAAQLDRRQQVRQLGRGAD